MKKTTLFIAAITVAFTFSMCTNTAKNEQKTTEATDANTAEAGDKPEKHDCTMPIPAGDSAKYISKEVTVKGDIENPLTLTVADLKKMKTVTIENFTVVCQSGANMKEDKSCKGVLLRDILEKAKIKQENHKDRNFYIVARASDNYKATFSWAELFNNPTGDNVYILFEENGEPIKSQGEMILICKNDIKTGPRHVYWLKSIEVNRVD